MALFPQQFVNDLKHHADIVVVIQDYVSLKKTGATYKGLCPFHGEKTPSFHVNRDKGFFHCFGCGVGGDVFKFLELHEKVGFQESVKMLAQRFGIPVPEMAAGDASCSRNHAAAASCTLSSPSRSAVPARCSSLCSTSGTVIPKRCASCLTAS